jgi:hypothetical protein
MRFPGYAALVRAFVAIIVALAGLVRLLPAAEVNVARLAGGSLAGELRVWNATELIVATDQGEQRIPLNQLLSVRFSRPDETPSNDSAKSPVAELIDGSQIPLAEYRVTGARAVISLPAVVTANQQEITLPVRQISAVRLKALSPTAAGQWDEIRAQNLPGDVLVVMKRGGESLDYVEGVVGDLSADKIDFKLDGEATRADRAVAAGVTYFRRDARAPSDPRCVIHGKSGLKAVVAEASVNGDSLRLKTMSGAELTWPLEDISLADFSAGKIAYLSDLDPASQQWTPLVALPSTAGAAAAYGKVRRDSSPFGGQLSLASSENAAANQRDRTRLFDKGLAIRSRTELVYRLPAGYRRFTAVAGIDSRAAAGGNLKLSIHGDDRVLFSRDIAGNEPPVPLDLEIAGVRRLTVSVDYGRNLDTGDWLILGDARIVK